MNVCEASNQCSILKLISFWIIFVYWFFNIWLNVVNNYNLLCHNHFHNSASYRKLQLISPSKIQYKKPNATIIISTRAFRKRSMLYVVLSIFLAFAINYVCPWACLQHNSIFHVWHPWHVSDSCVSHTDP